MAAFSLSLSFFVSFFLFLSSVLLSPQNTGFLSFLVSLFFFSTFLIPSFSRPLVFFTFRFSSSFPYFLYYQSVSRSVFFSLISFNLVYLRSSPLYAFLLYLFLLLSIDFFSFFRYIFFPSGASFGCPFVYIYIFCINNLTGSLFTHLYLSF